MAVSSLVAASSGGIKSVQRGSAGSSGTVTITAVDITKAFVNVFGTSSSGTVAASGTIASSTSSFPQTRLGIPNGFEGSLTTALKYSDSGTLSGINVNQSVGVIPATTITNNSTSISGGTTSLVAAVVQGYLSNSTSLVVSGACRWEVVEFN